MLMFSQATVRLIHSALVQGTSVILLAILQFDLVVNSAQVGWLVMVGEKVAAMVDLHS